MSVPVRKSKQKNKHKTSFRHRPETIEKIRLAMTGRHRSEESKKKMSLRMSGPKHPFYGKHFSEQHRRNLSLSHLGKKLSEEHKYKINVKHIAYWKRRKEKENV